MNEMKEDHGFLKWYVEENNLLDEDDVEEAIEFGNEYLAAGY